MGEDEGRSKQQVPLTERDRDFLSTINTEFERNESDDQQRDQEIAVLRQRFEAIRMMSEEIEEGAGTARTYLGILVERGVVQPKDGRMQETNIGNYVRGAQRFLEQAQNGLTSATGLENFLLLQSRRDAADFFKNAPIEGLRQANADLLRRYKEIEDINIGMKSAVDVLRQRANQEEAKARKK
ncbi:MAG: hypothetical protein HY420_01780 [Candidatus Kerfeldbacteria bacterium]|nr:hypothetical protein [Candidatus Kerfeldbacteria bacterium]